MIDCAEKDDGKDIAEFLEKKGITNLDYLIITHFDKDHIGGAAKVLHSVYVNMWMLFRTLGFRRKPSQKICLLNLMA